MTPLLAAFDYTIFPPINATLNGLSTVLLVVGVMLIKAGRQKAHQYAMTGALVSSALFLACYLTYHYGAGSIKFPTEYPVARKVYLTILIPHIILAVVNLPFIILLVFAAFRGNFEKHKRLAKFTFPSWLFVSVTGVIIYFMLYHWFLPSSPVPTSPQAAAAAAPRIPGPLDDSPPAPTSPLLQPDDARRKEGDLVFTPVSQTVKAAAGQASLEVFFQVENISSESIAIAALESGCECLEVSIDHNPIPARSTAKIKGIFDISKLRGSSDRKIIVTPDGSSRPLFLNTHIEIEPVYEITEAMTNWAKGSPPETKVVVFRVARKEPVHILSAESKRPEVSCELVEMEKGRLYHLKLTPTSTEKTLLGIVKIQTDCEIESQANALAYFSIQ